MSKIDYTQEPQRLRGRINGIKYYHTDAYNVAVRNGFKGTEKGWLDAIENNYVTPQMFGAVGDGVADDTAAFQAAVDTGREVALSNCIYRLNGTVYLKDGTRIVGSKNSIIRPYAPTVFHLAQRNTLEGFRISILSEDVLSVFEIDDESCSRDALMWDRITNVEVYNSVSATPEEFTVCHFHADGDNAGMYDVIIRDCTFTCNDTNGYAARVYSTPGNGSWFNAVVFEGCNTRNFKWHYFFANNDKDIEPGINGGHMINGCVAQCSPQTNGFVFMCSAYTASLRNCRPYDWASQSSTSNNCPGRPYVFSKDITPSMNTAAINEFYDSQQIIYYDGESFDYSNINRNQGLLLQMGNRYDYNLIPKYVAVPSCKAIKVFTFRDWQVNQTDGVRIRFYLCDHFGITYISVIPSKKVAKVSQPLPGYCIGMSKDGYRVYLYRIDEYKLGANMGIMSIPVSNSNKLFAALNSNAINAEKTAEVWQDPDSCCFDELPEEIERFTVELAQPLYIPGTDGQMYTGKVETAQDGSLSLTLTKAGYAVPET